MTRAGGSMHPVERRATFALAGIFGVRMFGLFMILPVFTLYAEGYRGYTPTLAGLAIGIYGLTQATLQIPFGMLSDRIGRKPVIALGLVLFAAGSALAALSNDMAGVIGGRALQGAGAVAATIMALTADLTREEQRTKAMAIIGVSIGMAFVAAMVFGPLLSRSLGLAGLFWVTTGLAFAAIALLFFVVPSPVRSTFHRDTEPVLGYIGRVLGDPELLRLDIGILILHLVLTATFVVVPLALRDIAGVPARDHWQIYLPILLLSVALMIPFLWYAERRRRVRRVFCGAVLLLGVALGGLGRFHDNLGEILLFLLAFFIAFNVLEATLPSLISRITPAEMKGTALGVYSTCQFLGAFLGGVGGGWVYANQGIAMVFGIGGGLVAVWLLLALTMRRPPHLTSHMVRLGVVSEPRGREVAAALTRVPGVAEAVVIAEEGIAYLKVDPRELDESALRAFSATNA